MHKRNRSIPLSMFTARGPTISFCSLFPSSFLFRVLWRQNINAKSTHEATAIEPTAIPTRGPVCSFLSSWSIGVSVIVGSLIGSSGWFGWSRGFFGGGVRVGAGEGGILANEFPPTLWCNCTNYQNVIYKKIPTKGSKAYWCIHQIWNWAELLWYHATEIVVCNIPVWRWITIQLSYQKYYEGKISSHILISGKSLTVSQGLDYWGHQLCLIVDYFACTYKAC